MSPPMETQLTKAVRKALTEAPVSLREIGRRSGVSTAQIARLAAGERNATPAIATAIAKALDTLSADCAAGAARIHRALTHHPEERA